MITVAVIRRNRIIPDARLGGAQPDGNGIVELHTQTSSQLVADAPQVDTDDTEQPADSTSYCPTCDNWHPDYSWTDEGCHPYHPNIRATCNKCGDWVLDSIDGDPIDDCD